MASRQTTSMIFVYILLVAVLQGCLQSTGAVTRATLERFDPLATYCPEDGVAWLFLDCTNSPDALHYISFSARMSDGQLAHGRYYLQPPNPREAGSIVDRLRSVSSSFRWNGGGHALLFSQSEALTSAMVAMRGRLPESLIPSTSHLPAVAALVLSAQDEQLVAPDTLGSFLSATVTPDPLRINIWSDDRERLIDEFKDAPVSPTYNSASGLWQFVFLSQEVDGDGVRPEDSRGIIWMMARFDVRPFIEGLSR